MEKQYKVGRGEELPHFSDGNILEKKLFFFFFVASMCDLYITKERLAWKKMDRSWTLINQTNGGKFLQKKQ